MPQSVFKKDEIILLLGAGASVEAKIPDSHAMIDKIESLIQGRREWIKFRHLYNFVKSSIYFAEGLDGSFGPGVPFNVERLVDALQELENREHHPLSPFVASWDRRLTEILGEDSALVVEFRQRIVGELRNNWVQLSKIDQASYFRELLRFQGEFQYPLRIFSLNYDLCVEKACEYKNVQRGFENGSWDWRAFEDAGGETLPLLLYKLHGSIDWQTDANGRVEYLDSPSKIANDDDSIVFGTSYKRQYVDPFLFLAYEFRRWTLDAAKVIVSIGYSFGDDHINGIVEQSLKQDRKRRVVAVFEPLGDEVAKERRRMIAGALSVDESRIEIVPKGAREYMKSELTIANLSELLPPDDGDEIPTLN